MYRITSKQERQSPPPPPCIPWLEGECRMNKTFGVIGGDRRQAELARLLAEEGRTVWTSGVADAQDNPGRNT